MHSSAKLAFENDMLKISCETESGKVNDLIPVHMEGEAREVLFNQNFLIEALRACDNQKVLLRVADSGRGTVSYTHLFTRKPIFKMIGHNHIINGNIIAQSVGISI